MYAARQRRLSPSRTVLDSEPPAQCHGVLSHSLGSRRAAERGVCDGFRIGAQGPRSRLLVDSVKWYDRAMRSTAWTKGSRSFSRTTLQKRFGRGVNGKQKRPQTDHAVWSYELLATRPSDVDSLVSRAFGHERPRINAIRGLASRSKVPQTVGQWHKWIRRYTLRTAGPKINAPRERTRRHWRKRAPESWIDRSMRQTATQHLWTLTSIQMLGRPFRQIHDGIWLSAIHNRHMPFHFQKGGCLYGGLRMGR